MKWIKGLVGALLAGAGNAVSMMVVDPVSFNLQEGWERLGTAALIGAILGGAAYMKKSPE